MQSKKGEKKNTGFVFKIINLSQTFPLWNGGGGRGGAVDKDGFCSVSLSFSAFYSGMN